jgi:threonyl-tRNA synthetase
MAHPRSTGRLPHSHRRSEKAGPPGTGPRLGLFSIEHEEGGSGFIYWLPKGAVLRRIIEDTLKDYLSAHGYDFVYTPHVARSVLWKTSGHLDYYRDNMYPAMELESQEFLLKPMNCPGHILIYKNGLHSYRELPIRYAEFGTVYRFERSGVLHGLMRVRGFTQDDAHIFCRPDQVEAEVVDILKIITEILSMFGFKDYEVKLSTRPDKYSGTLEGWAHAEGSASKSARNRRAALHHRSRRRGLLRTENRLKNQRFARPPVAMFHRSSGLQ